MRSKVIAYVTRGQELLVFRHRDFPEAGLQVPGGSIEDGEDPDEAVLRELQEESGLTDVRLVGLLGRYLYSASPNADESHDRHVYHLELTGPAEESWLHWENDPSDGSPPIAFEFFWMSLNNPDLQLAGGRGDLLHKLRPSTIPAEAGIQDTHHGKE